MRVTLARSGGFAGILPPPVTLDTAALPRDVASHIEELVASADFFNLPHTLAAAARQPDRLQFTLRIVDDNRRDHTVNCDEEAAPEPFLELVRTVQKAGRNI
jgi:hypothetical protein